MLEKRKHMHSYSMLKYLVAQIGNLWWSKRSVDHGLGNLTSVFPGAVTMRPLEQILNEIRAINSCSDTTIWRVIKQAGQDADRILSEVNYQNVKLALVFVAIDETYFNGYPIFFIVEPISLTICAYYIPSDKDRSADCASRPLGGQLELSFRTTQKRAESEHNW